MPRPVLSSLPPLALSLALCLTGSALATQAAAAPKVVTSIKPVQSLVAAVMGDMGTPDLIIEGAGSPHGYQLKPSQAAALQEADAIFWIGPDLESFLAKPIETIAGDARSVELINTPGLTLLAPREGGAFEAHDHAHEDHGHDEDAHEDHADENHDEHAEAAHDHTEGDEADHHHGPGEVDPHVWLDPENAKAFVRQIAETLSELDPGNAATYASNAERQIAALDQLEQQIGQLVAPVRDEPFIVFHDAYHYFENRFDIEAAGSITVNPELRPGAERIAEIQARLKDAAAACVFSEPQFEPKIVAVVTEGTDARSGVLDPLGADLESGPGLYPALIENLARAMTDCLDGDA